MHNGTTPARIKIWMYPCISQIPQASSVPSATDVSLGHPHLFPKFHKSEVVCLFRFYLADPLESQDISCHRINDHLITIAITQWLFPLNRVPLFLSKSCYFSNEAEKPKANRLSRVFLKTYLMNKMAIDEVLNLALQTRSCGGQF